MNPKDFKKQFGRAFRGQRVEGLSEAAIGRLLPELEAKAATGDAQAQPTG